MLQADKNWLILENRKTKLENRELLPMKHPENYGNNDSVDHLLWHQQFISSRLFTVDVKPLKEVLVKVIELNHGSRDVS